MAFPPNFLEELSSACRSANEQATAEFSGTQSSLHCFENDDISSGRGADLSFFGSSLNEAFGNGWSISNSFIFDGGYLNTHAMINNGNPQALSAFIAGMPACNPATRASMFAGPTDAGRCPWHLCSWSGSESQSKQSSRSKSGSCRRSS